MSTNKYESKKGGEIGLSLVVIDSFKKIESKCHEPSVHGIFVVTIFHMTTNLTTEMKIVASL